MRQEFRLDCQITDFRSRWILVLWIERFYRYHLAIRYVNCLGSTLCFQGLSMLMPFQFQCWKVFYCVYRSLMLLQSVTLLIGSVWLVTFCPQCCSVCLCSVCWYKWEDSLMATWAVSPQGSCLELGQPALSDSHLQLGQSFCLPPGLHKYCDFLIMPSS